MKGGELLIIHCIICFPSPHLPKKREKCPAASHQILEVGTKIYFNEGEDGTAGQRGGLKKTTNKPKYIRTFPYFLLKPELTRTRDEAAAITISTLMLIGAPCSCLWKSEAGA